jgi:hypothetical protein
MNIKRKKILSYSSIIATPCLRPMNEEIKQRLLNAGSNIKNNNFFIFIFLHIFKGMKQKKSKIYIYFFFNLDVNKFNSPSRIGSFSLSFL